MPTYLFGLLFLFAPGLLGIQTLSTSAQGSLLLLLFMNTFLAPALLIYYFYRLGVVKSLHLDTLRDRRLPYLTTVLIYAMATYLFGWQFQPISALAPNIAVVLGSITFSMAVVALVSLRWKISAHATGMGGCLGAIACLFLRFGDNTLFYPLLLGILLTGWLLSARLHLNAHTPTQVGAGLLLGLVVSSAAIFIFF
jgi:membrane-associated phospholipid phosphatase